MALFGAEPGRGMTEGMLNAEPFPERAVESVAAAALDLVGYVRRQVFRRKPADVAVARYFAMHRELGSRDRHFLSDIVFSYFRWRGWFLANGVEDIPLACAVAYALDAWNCPNALERVAQYSPFWHEKKFSFVPLGGRQLEERRRWVESALGRSYTWEQLVPSWVPGVLFIPENADDLLHQYLASFQVRPPVWLHVFRGRRDEVLNRLRAEGVESAEAGPLPGTIRIPEQVSLHSLPRDLRKNFIIQDLSSQCVARVCDPRPGERWFDACAGAGGKTLHLADLMNDEGEVAATDVRGGMLRELYRRARDAGMKSIRIGSGKGEADFDGVLVDAPCSGLGTWSRNPDARWRVRKGDIRWAARRQADILGRAARRVRPGGRLVYSVCTMTTSETVDIVEAFLEKHDGFVLDSFVHPLRPAPSAGGMEWIWPWDGPCGGMFLARFRRES